MHVPADGSKKSNILPIVAGVCGVAVVAAVWLAMRGLDGSDSERPRSADLAPEQPGAPRSTDPEAERLARAAEDPPPEGAAPIAAQPTAAQPTSTATAVTAVTPPPPPAPDPGPPVPRAQKPGRDLMMVGGPAAAAVRPAAPANATQPTAHVEWVQGSLAQSDVRYATESVGPLVHGCYAKRDNPAAGGRLTLRFKVVVNGGAGRVTEVGFVDDTVRDDAVTSCVQDGLSVASFPMPSNTGQMQVEYPFDLRPDS